jgi:hypothetical protein
MSKSLTDRQGATEIVASAAETHAERAAEKFAAVFKDRLEGTEQMPDVALVLRLFARQQRWVTALATAADEAHEKELGDDASPRERRDSATSKLATELGEIRDTLDSTFGTAIVKELGLDGRVESEPKAVLARAKRLVSALSDPKRIWPMPKRKGVKVDPSAWVEDLHAPIGVLDAALGDVARELREAQASSEARNQALSANDDAFSRLAGAIAGVLRVVGEDALAARVRPSTRRPGQVASEEEAPAAGNNAAAAAEGVPPA